MNANELADELSWSEMDTDEIETWTKEAVTMLRQQQAEIANLKAGLLSHHDIYPLKELTDEEITAIWQTDECYQKAQNFARAILKKSGEK